MDVIAATSIQAKKAAGSSANAGHEPAPRTMPRTTNEPSTMHTIIPSQSVRRRAIGRVTIALTLVSAGGFAATLQGPSAPSDHAAPRATAQAPSPAPSGDATPAQREIGRARRSLAAGPATAENHTMLAIALSKRARETADPEWYDRSDEELKASLELAPDNFPARRQQVWNQLGRHEFAAALTGAKALNERAKDDVLTYGLLVDANIELGRYGDAEVAAQWMLNLRPGAPAALTRVSYLREQFGDVSGAIEAMDMAFHSTRPSDREDRAWILTHLAHLESERGHAERAATYAENALLLFPDYHYALAELARARADAGNLEAARVLLTRRFQVAGHPENLFQLAACARACGDEAEAASMFATFESDALAESTNVDNANLELVEYWLEHSNHVGDVERALLLATTRANGRRDVATLASLAWAQHRAGDHESAWKTMGEALAVGTRHPKTRYRAGEIALAAGHTDDARTQWEQALQDAPRSTEGRLALKALMRLEN